MAGLRQALFDGVTEADVAEIAQGLVKKAKEGDLAATKLLLSYLVGGVAAGGGGTTIKNFGELTLVNEAGRPPKSKKKLPLLDGRITNGSH